MKDHFFRWVNLTIALVGFFLIPVKGEDSSKQTVLDAAVVSEQELVRRQEALIDAQMLIKEAENQISLRNFSKALGYYQEAEKKISKAPASAEFVAQIQHGESLCLYQMGAEAFDKKDFAQAAEQSAKAYQLDPQNRDALDLHESALSASKQYEARKQRGVAEAAAAPEINNKDFQDKQKRILDLYRSYENYFKSEQYDQAEAALKEILRIDPYSASAYHRLREVQLAKLRKMKPAQTQTEQEAMTDAQRAWVLPNRRDVPSVINKPGGEPIEGIGNKGAILKKLNSIIISKIEFDNTPIKDAINRLIDLSREADEPTHEGVNILLSLGRETGGAAPAPAPAPEAGPGGGPGGFGAPGAAPAAPTEAPPVETSSSTLGGITVSLNLRNINLLNVIKFLTKVTQLKYQVEPEAVTITTEVQAGSTQMQTRIFNMSPGVFVETFAKTEGAAPAGGGGGGGGFVRFQQTTAKTKEADVKKAFEDFGVAFPAGASISYNEVLGLLVATNTPDKLDQIEAIVLKLNKTPPQVTIEAKFMDIRQSDLEDLSFEWAFAQATQKDYVIESGRGTSLPGLPIGHTFGGGRPTYLGLGNPLTGGTRNSTTLQGNAIDALLAGASAVNPTIATITGLLSDPQVQLYIDALSQKGITDLLQAPRVTTTSGESAKILVTREFIYPSTYSEPTVVAGTSSATGGGAGSVGIAAPSPTAFSTREVGVILDVKPQVGPDGFTIALTLSPEVVDFEGFINYNTFAVANGTSFTFPIQQPVFNKRTITTSVTIWDGQTVVLGGLINDTTSKINDKVPFLGDLPIFGRLFQSKVDQTTKRNLVIFLNARVVDPSGKPVHSFEQVSLTSSAPPSTTE